LGLQPPDDSVATSVEFDVVKSFYGDAYEVFAGSVDFFAMLNNVKLGREFSEFDQLTLKNYYKITNASKFNPFSTNAAFIAVCEEKDNQLRNASHHRGLKIDQEGRTISFKAGKGGTGDEQQLSYAEYLDRSSRIFLQICVLVATELVFCTTVKIYLPFY
jgi:hypothetical protein